MIQRIIIFLLLNFAALAIGGLATSDGVVSDWYNTLDKAPWTPPGWVFGAAWTTIMICFSIYMAMLWGKAENKTMVRNLYIFQWILNVGWNPIFFRLHLTLNSLIVIIALTVLVGYFLWKYYIVLKNYSFLILPYFIWLLIATSLNAYVVLNN